MAPDGAIALATPTTARYVRAVADRPVAGPAAVVHHLALAPVEATWAFVPAMGGCVDAEGTVDGELLCYDRFPSTIIPGDDGGSALATPLGAIAFDGAPVGYLAFLLVPLVATAIGGRSRGGRRPSLREAFVRSSAAGVAFGVAVGVAACSSRVTVGYVADVAGEVTRGSCLGRSGRARRTRARGGVGRRRGSAGGVRQPVAARNSAGYSTSPSTLIDDPDDQHQPGTCRGRRRG